MPPPVTTRVHPSGEIQIVPVEETQHAADAWGVKREFDVFKTLLKESASTENLRRKTDEELMDQAAGYVLDNFPDEPDEAQIRKRTEYWFKVLRDTRDKEIAGREKVIGGAVRLGAGRPGVELPSSERVQAAMGGTPWRDSEFPALSQTKQLPKSAPELQRAILRGEGQIPAEDKAHYGGPYKPVGNALHEFIGLSSRMAKGAKKGELETNVEVFGRPDITLEEMEQMRAASGNLRVTGEGHELQSVQPSDAAGLDKLGQVSASRVGGVRKSDLGNFPIVHNIGGTLKGAYQGMLQGEGEDASALHKNFYETRQWYLDQAARLALEKLGPQADNATVRAETEANFATLLANDEHALSLLNPHTGEAGYALLGDVSPVGTIAGAPIIAGTKIAYRGAKAVPHLGTAIHAGEDALREIFQRAPQVEKLRSLGPEGEGVANATQAALDRSSVASETLEAIRNQWTKLGKGLKPSEVGFAADYLAGQVGLEALPKRVRKLAPKLNKLRDEATQAQLSTGQLRRIVNDESLPPMVGEPILEEFYTPHVLIAGQEDAIAEQLYRGGFRNMDELKAALSGHGAQGNLSAVSDEVKALALGAPPPRGARASMETGAQIERVPNQVDWEPSPFKQWDARLKGEARIAKQAAFAQEIDSALTRMDLRVSTDILDPAHVPIAEAQLSEKWGMRVRALPKDLQRDYLRWTAPEGTAITPERYDFLPADVVDELERLVPKVGTPTAQDNFKKRVLVGLNDYLWKPYRAMWGSTKTLGGFGQYLLGQFEGNAMNYFASRGLKSANPNIIDGATQVAKKASGAGVGKPLSGSIPLPSGEHLTYEQAYNILSKYGKLGQTNIKYGFDLPIGKGPLAVAAQGVRSTLAPVGKVASFADDSMKAAVFMSELKSLAPDEILRALNDTDILAGNMRRLSWVEQNIVRQAVPFYAWNKFYYPFVAKQLIKNPQNLDIIRQAQNYAQQAWGYQAPMVASQVPDRMKAAGFVGPSSAQPSKEDKQRLGIPHDVATMSRFESPLGVIEDLGKLVDISMPNDNSALGATGPQSLGFFIAATGYDPITRTWIDKSLLPELAGVLDSANPALELRSRLKKSRVGGVGYDAIQRPTDAMLDIFDLYWNNGTEDGREKASNWYKRWAVYNLTLGLSAAGEAGYNAAAPYLGTEPVQPQTFGFPGMISTPTEPSAETSRDAENALKVLQQRYQLTR